MTTIYDPIQINTMTLKNRLVMPPMATYHLRENNILNNETVDYYEQRAKNSKIDCIITEFMYISLEGRARNLQLSISDDQDIEGLSKLVNAIHKHGVKAICQINHAGCKASPLDTGMPSKSASVNEHHKTGEKSEVLTIDEIIKIQDDFVKAAVRAKKAGYDGVEIHSAHGYLLNQFYSPLTNRREDEYGYQSIESRVKFQLEVIQKVRNAVGDDYPVFIRLGGCDYMEGGSTIEDCVKACTLFEKAGVDCIDLSGGLIGYIVKGRSEPGYFKDMTEAVKDVVSIPVINTGGITTLKEAEDVMREEIADLLGIGRAIFKDAYWYKL